MFLNDKHKWPLQPPLEIFQMTMTIFGTFDRTFSQLFCILLVHSQIHNLSRLHIGYMQFFFLRVLRKIYFQQNSKADAFWAHIECLIFFLHLLSEQRAAIVFQPTARASAAHTKTNRRSAIRLEGVEKNLSAQCVCGMCLLWNFTENKLSPIVLEKKLVHIPPTVENERISCN